MANGVPSLNDRATTYLRTQLSRAAELNVSGERVLGTRVIDAGVERRGSLEAGLVLARASLADLADVTLTPGRVKNTPLAEVAVNVHQPVAACMASQYAGWQISVDDFFAMGSGPMRAAYGEEPLFNEIGFRESPKVAVGLLETSASPTEKVVAHLAEKCRVEPDNLTLLCARTASLAGGVQVVARTVETALHKLHEIGFDLARVVGGFGVAPLPPVAEDDLHAIGRTNDAVLYGARTNLFVLGDDDTLADLGPRLPSSASEDYGRPFSEIFKACDYEFYKLDPMLFSPACVVMQNLDTGRTHRFGVVNEDVLAHSFFGD